MTHRNRSTSTSGDRGQATVELALVLPLICLLLCAIVQVAVIGRDQLAVQLAAREAARAAAVAADPATAATAAAHRAIALRPLAVGVREANGMVTATVRYTDGTDVPLIGTLLPAVTFTATVTMQVEPP